MNLPEFIYHAPASIQEYTTLVAACGDDWVLMGGGTDLLVRMKQRLARPVHLVSVTRVEGADAIEYREGQGMILGAGVRLAQIANSRVVKERFPVVADAASMVAGRQIRNMATLGGNLCQDTRCFYYNRSRAWGQAVPPCVKRGGQACHAVRGGKRCLAVYRGDLAPVLIALGAVATIVHRGTTAQLPLKGLFSGDGAGPFTDRFFILSVIVPPGGAGQFAGYRKHRLRGGLDFPIAGVVASGRRKGGRVSGLRLCLTGVAPSPLIVEGAAEAAEGNMLNDALRQELSRLAFRACHPVENTESTAERRRSMIRIMTDQLLREIASHPAP